VKRLLILSTTFFPDPAVAAIRMTQWCRHLPAHGWKPHVLCRYYGFEASREALAASVHADVSIEYLERPDAPRSRLAGLGLRPRSLSTLLVPDPSVRFWRGQHERVLARVRELQPDVILTTSPPHANHEIGLWLAAETGIPWIADFRDPYVIDPRFRPAGLGRVRGGDHLRFEAAIYRRAWLITHAIPFQARWARRRYPFARERIRTLTNGFPLEMLSPAAAPAGARRRSIRVVGTILDAERLQLAQAVARLVEEGHDLELQLVGRAPRDPAPLHAALGERLVLAGYQSHAESVRRVASAAVLVNFLDAQRSASWLLSTKMFEYLASDRPVITVNPSRSDQLLLRRVSGVAVLRRPAPADLTQALRSALALPSRGDPGLAAFRRDFNWARLGGRLAGWLDQLVSFPAAAALPAAVPSPVASVVVPTRNRKDLLRQMIRSALAQTVPVEVLVMDDGSTDGTGEMVRREFPQVRYFELGKAKGPAFQRNRGIELARAEIVFPLDDDSMFSSARVVEQTLKEFDNARVAAVGIPFLNPRLDWTCQQRAPAPGAVWVEHAFVGAAHAVRRSVFLQAGGFREHFFYMGEEGDLCVRLLDAGYVVRLGAGDPVHHLESPRRNLALADYCGRRNDVLFAWLNVPLAFLPLHLLATTFNGLRAALRSQNPGRMLLGVLHGYAGSLQRWRERRPVSVQTYRLHRRLKKAGPRTLDDLGGELPPLRQPPVAADLAR
jgi:GT2 family glycosyltransferase/glycosyltransferase involved in cell wall biosynthesis